MRRATTDERRGQGAAIVCKHFAERSAPVTIASRDEPLEPADGGWQFLCGASHRPEDALVWTVAEVVEEDPTIAEVLSHPPGSRLERDGEGAPWRSPEERAKLSVPWRPTGDPEKS